MANSLREDVETLADLIADGRTVYSVGGIENALRRILARPRLLDRHPPADAVSVPRDLLLRLGVKIAKALPKTHPMTYDDDLSALLKLLYVTAADLDPVEAILSTGARMNANFGCPETGEEDCPMCAGEFCRQCGPAGPAMRNCEHDSPERHAQPKADTRAQADTILAEGKV